LLAGNITGIISQRLARTLCRSCSTRRRATADECRVMGLDPNDPPELGQPVGCPECRFTGYRGRMAVHELLPMNRHLDEIILDGKSLVHLKEEARRFGFVSIVDDGFAKVLAGHITLDSLSRTVDITDRL
jgi:general secretion pathway protein E/type IV pilus assembly protein PilB